MENFFNFYQHLPEKINPVVFQMGGFKVGWYSLMYLVAFLVVYAILSYRIKKKEANLSLDDLVDFLFYAFWGMIIGARLGYVLFYNFTFFLHHPLNIISPYDFSSGRFTGISGMSYHGGLIGIILASWYFSRQKKINFWKLSDFVIPAVPAGYFFGRIGNFLNGELFGRITESHWGMFFSAGGNFLRHPSQIYEAFFEGIVLFVFLFFLRNRKELGGHFLEIYILGYGIFRFFIEFFRQPDSQIGFVLGLTLCQILSLAMILSAFLIFIFRKKRYN